MNLLLNIHRTSDRITEAKRDSRNEWEQKEIIEEKTERN
jgi:hypothetical protein